MQNSTGACCGVGAPLPAQSRPSPAPSSPLLSCVTEGPLQHNIMLHFHFSQAVTASGPLHASCQPMPTFVSLRSSCLFSRQTPFALERNGSVFVCHDFPLPAGRPYRRLSLPAPLRRHVNKAMQVSKATTLTNFKPALSRQVVGSFTRRLV